MQRVGWVKLWRKLKDADFYRDSEALHLFIECITSAYFKDTEYRGRLIQRGSFGCTDEILCTRLDWSKGKLDRNFKKLHGTIDKISEGPGKAFSIITTINYETYQGGDDETGEQTDHQTVHRIDHQIDHQTGQQEKNSNKDEEGQTTLSCDSELLSWIEWWNRLHASGLVSAGVDATPPSAGTTAGWKRVKRDAALRTMLQDRAVIEQEIRQASFVREGAWFTLGKLLGGKNQDREFIITKLLNGGYRDGSRTGKADQASRARDPERAKLYGGFDS